MTFSMINGYMNNGINKLPIKDSKLFGNPNIEHLLNNGIHVKVLRALFNK